MTRKGHGGTEMNDDDRTACRQLSLVLALLAHERPVPVAQIDSRYSPDLSPASARKRRSRIEESLSQCGVRIRKTKANDGSLCWSVDEASFATGALPVRDAQLVRALATPLADDPGYSPWRHDLYLALAKLSDDPQVSRLTPLAAQRRSEDDADPHVTSALATCLARNVAAEFDYTDADGRESHRIVDPIGFFDLRSHSYLASVLVAGEHAGETRTFRCDRIARVRVTRMAQGTHPGVSVASFRRLPFQMGDANVTCTFDVSALSGSRLAQTTRGHGSLSSAGEATTWEVDAASLADAAAWAVAENVVPIAPAQLVDAWKDVLALSRTETGGALPAQATTPGGSGRTGSGRTLRTLLAMSAGLAQGGAAISAGSVSRRFGVSHAEARRLLELLLYATGGSAEQEALLRLDLSDDGERLTALGDAPSRIAPLRMTPLEAAALEGALNKAGMPQDDAVRSRLRESFWPTGNLVVAPEGPPDARLTYPALATCIVAGLSRRALSFSYQGQRDGAPRRRRVAEPRPWQDGERWMLDARDLDASPGDDERTFVISGMGDLRILDPVPEASGHASPDVRREVQLAFADPHLLDLLDWPGLDLIETSRLPLVGRITYTGGTWLLRRIAAGGGTITTTDDALWEAVREYAASLLYRLDERHSSM